MFRSFLAALFGILLVAIPFQANSTQPGSSNQAPITAKDVRRAEASAKTASDHNRLADYYRSQAEQAQKNLSYAQDLENQWSWMAGRSKVSNAYTAAHSLVDRYSADLQKYNQLAADHEKAAKALQTSAPVQ